MVGVQQVEVLALWCWGGGRGCFGHMCRFRARGNSPAGAAGSLLSPVLQIFPRQLFWAKFSVQSGPGSLLEAKIRNIALQSPGERVSHGPPLP